MGSMSPSDSLDPDAVLRDHRRQWRDCLYVYPVISRRAGGLSIGVNLNIDKRCNFACVYCQINRRIRRQTMTVDMQRLRQELELALEAARSGLLWDEERFAGTPEALRTIHDIAFSGDGEPTCVENIDTAVATAADLLRDNAMIGKVKIVLITNASHLCDPQSLRALAFLNEADGEIWAKLDAGTEEYFQRVNRPAGKLTLEDITRNITDVARRHPVVIQTLWFRLDGQSPPEEEIAAYIRRLREMLQAGATFRLIQLHTIARSPAESSARALSDEELDAIAHHVRTALPDIPVQVYYGQDVPPQNADDGRNGS